MKARCPKNPEHNRFTTCATVAALWLVDEEGNWKATIEGEEEIIEHVDSGNLWECAAPDCGAEAIVED